MKELLIVVLIVCLLLMPACTGIKWACERSDDIKVGINNTVSMFFTVLCSVGKSLTGDWEAGWNDLKGAWSGLAGSWGSDEDPEPAETPTG